MVVGTLEGGHLGQKQKWQSGLLAGWVKGPQAAGRVSGLLRGLLAELHVEKGSGAVLMPGFWLLTKLWAWAPGRPPNLEGNPHHGTAVKPPGI